MKYMDLFQHIPGGQYFFLFMTLFTGFMIANTTINISYYAANELPRTGSYGYLPIGCRSMLAYLFLLFKMVGVLCLVVLAVAAVFVLLVPAIQSSMSFQEVGLHVGTFSFGLMFWFLAIGLYVWALRLEYQGFREEQRQSSVKSFF